MKRIAAFAALACLVTPILDGCVTIDPMTVRPLNAGRAQPYIQAALSAPMDKLYVQATTGQAYDWLSYGLALAAGRPSPMTVSADDAAILQALDARLQPAMQAWRTDHKTGDPDKVDWRKRIALSDDEAAAVRRVEEATSADYWLSRAANASTSNMTFIYMPATTKGGAGYTMPISTYSSVIPYDVLFSAGDCVTAVRTAAGFPTPPAVPEVVRRLREPFVSNYQTLFMVDMTQNDPRGLHATGPEACGAGGAFANDIRQLTSAVAINPARTL